LAALGDLPRLAARLSRDFTERAISHAVSGAAAMAVHGYVRATVDLDVHVVVPAIRFPEVFAIVRSLGFAGEDRELIAGLRDRYVAELRSGAASVEIRIPVLPYHRTLVDRAVRVDVDGVAVPFVSLEDLVVLKMLWHRAKDVPDVHALLTAGGARIDREYVASTLDSILPADDPRHAEMRDLFARFAG
jgi:hypothetical protein